MTTTHMAAVIQNPIRIAMWSGPRNISTAMMRAWENRPDTFVVDEPLYGYYLAQTGADHPGAAEVIAATETDWRKIATSLTSDPAPRGRRIFYQKQMTHHLLPEVERGWLIQLTNCFLIRDPAEVIASYTKKNHAPSLEEIGFLQQAEIFHWINARTKAPPPIIDARDVLENPRRLLGLLCQAIGVEFSEKMLSWPPGRRATDGIWAKHWYAEVEKSTGFQPPRSYRTEVPPPLRAVYEKSREAYEELHAQRLR